MVRKQVYLLRGQDQKLKRLAARRGCTEAEVIREAIDYLPDPSGSVIEQLRAAGVLTIPRDEPDALSGAALRALEDEVYAWLDVTPPLGLSAAVIDDREDRGGR